MEDYIFIIIAIVLSIFGAINKKKKEDARAAEQGSSHGEKSVFSDVFDDEFFSPVKPAANTVPPPVVKPAPKPKEKMQAPRKMEAPARLQRQPLKREFLKHSYNRPERKIEQLEIVKLGDHSPTTTKKTHSVLDGFSLKKAVIYSEILQRKF